MLIVAARMIPGSSATIAASQVQRQAVRAVTTTTMIHRPTNNKKKFRSKNFRALSNSAPAAKGANEFSANPRAP